MSWRICLILAAGLSVLTFTPLVIPEGEIEPMLAGIPVTLWTGGLITVALVVLTYVAGRVHPELRRGGDPIIDRPNKSETDGASPAEDAP